MAFPTRLLALRNRNRTLPASSSETRTGSCGPSSSSHPKVCRVLWTPLMGFIFRPTADKHRVSTPGRASSSFGPKLPHSRRVPLLSFLPTSAVCSTRCRAGLLHPAAGWGSPGCRSRSPSSRKRSAFGAFLAGVTPFKAFPSRAAFPPSPQTNPSSPKFWAPSPLSPVWCRRSPCCHAFRRLRPSSSTSRLCSAQKSVAVRRVFHLRPARCSHGLLYPPMSVMPAGRIAPARHKLHSEEHGCTPRSAQ